MNLSKEEFVGVVKLRLEALLGELVFVKDTFSEFFIAEQASRMVDLALEYSGAYQECETFVERFYRALEQVIDDVLTEDEGTSFYESEAFYNYFGDLLYP